MDLFSTVLELAGIDPAAATAGVDAIDSTTLFPILKGGDSLERCAVVERFGNGSGDGRGLVSGKLLSNGNPASRVNSAGVSDRYFVQIAFDPVASGLSAGTHPIVVTFPGTTPRVFTALNNFMVR